jgi:cytochrome c oxidase subunit III
VRALAEAPRSWRATFVTSVLSAEIQGVVCLVKPSWWPIVAGVFLTAAFVGELIDSYPLLVGSLVGLGLAVIVWLWPSREERELPEVDAEGRLHGLPCYLSGTASTVWWTMALILVVFAVALSLLVFSYFYLRSGAADWPPPGIPKPGLLAPALGAGLLLASCPPMWLADRAIRRGDRGLLVLGLAGGFGLAAAFLGLQLAEQATLPFTHTTNAYGSIFFLLAWFETLLVGGGLIMSGVVQLQAWLGYFTRYRFGAVENLAMYWYFMAAAWLVVAGVIYGAPHVL